MRGRLRATMTRWAGPRLLDIALAAVFVAIGQVDVWYPWGDTGDGEAGGAVAMGGPQWLNAVLVLGIGVPLAWRRRRPLLTCALMAIAVLAELSVSGTALFFGAYLPVLVAAYSVGAYAPPRPAATGLALCVTTVYVVTVSIPELRSLDDMIFEPACVLALWLVGRLVYRQRTQARSARERAEASERRRDEDARVAVTTERTRIARELHDVIAHSVSLMGIQAAAAEQVLALDPERAREPLRAIQDTARDAIDELRRLLGVLREADEAAALVPQPGLAALEALVEQMRSAGLPVELRSHGEARRLSPGVELSAYRVVQEALTNTLKHAGAVATTVTVHHRADLLEVEIADHGRRDGDGDGTGHGLIGMRERVALYGGTLAAGRRADGYLVRASIPTGGRGA